MGECNRVVEQKQRRLHAVMPFMQGEKGDEKMNTEINEVEVNGVKYVKKGCEKEASVDFNGMKYVIVRTYTAGVFAGYVESKNGKEVVLRNVRRLWYWSGAASLSQLAVEGTKKAGECKFPVAVDRIELTEAIEILDVTKKAQKSIEGVPVWEA